MSFYPLNKRIYTFRNGSCADPGLRHRLFIFPQDNVLPYTNHVLCNMIMSDSFDARRWRPLTGLGGVRSFYRVTSPTAGSVTPAKDGLMQVPAKAGLYRSMELMLLVHKFTQLHS